MRSRAIPYVAWLVVLAGISLLGACNHPKSDEARLRQAVTAIQKAAEGRQTGPILDYLDETFEGNQAYRKANIRAMLQLYFRQNPHVRVFLHITRIQVDEDTAKLSCEVLLTGRDRRVLPERVRPLVVDTLWQKHDGDWWVVRARWRDPLVQP